MKDISSIVDDKGIYNFFHENTDWFFKRIEEEKNGYIGEVIRKICQDYLEIANDTIEFSDSEFIENIYFVTVINMLIPHNKNKSTVDMTLYFKERNSIDISTKDFNYLADDMHDEWFTRT